MINVSCQPHSVALAIKQAHPHVASVAEAYVNNDWVDDEVGSNGVEYGSGKPIHQFQTNQMAQHCVVGASPFHADIADARISHISCISPLLPETSHTNKLNPEAETAHA